MSEISQMERDEEERRRKIEEGVAENERLRQQQDEQSGQDVILLRCSSLPYDMSGGRSSPGRAALRIPARASSSSSQSCCCCSEIHPNI
eukprot:753945-Hanusia_phi.AAC.6